MGQESRLRLAIYGPHRQGSSGRGEDQIEAYSLGGFDPDEWELPPKPKWMRWKTYNRMVERFDQYEANVEEGLLEAIMRLGFNPLG